MGIRHRFRVDGRRYVYDAVSSEICELSEELFGVLPQWDRLKQANRHGNLIWNAKGKLVDEIEKACQEGLLSKDLPSLVNPVTFPSFAKALNRSASAISLCLTEKCNLRCIYCPYTQNIGSRRTHSLKTMSLQTCKQALVFFREILDEKETPVVSFYGGEPLLEFSLLQSIVEFAKRILEPKQVEFNMTTNGTVMDQQIAKFLVENNFYLVVSLDGPQEIHDRYRMSGKANGSYLRVKDTLSMLKDLSPSYFRGRVVANIVLAPPLQITVLNEYLTSEMPVPLEHCTTSLVDASDTNFLQMYPYTQSDVRSINVLRRRAEKAFITRKWDNEPLAILLFQKSLLRIAFRNRSNISGKPFIATGQCFPGGHKIFVDIEGFLHICERIDEGCPIGHLYAGIDVDAVKETLFPFFEDALKTCRDCYGLRLCGVCVEGTLKGGRFDTLKKNKACAEAKWRLHNNLVSYVRIIEQNPRAFDKFSPPEPQKSFVNVMNL